MEYDFTLNFKLPTAESDTDQLIERLAAAGCDDALVGTGRPGRVALNFTREARSAADAIVGAIRDVRRTIPDAQLVEAGPDLVGLTDVAEMMDVSRQYVRKLMISNSDSFPSPIHDSGSGALWHLRLVLGWLHERGAYHAPQAQFEVANVAMQVNLIKEADRLVEDKFRREIRALVA